MRTQNKPAFAFRKIFKTDYEQDVILLTLKLRELCDIFKISLNTTECKELVERLIIEERFDTMI
jgi:hypothetical protein